jgi:hypothetical protein
MCRRQNLSVGMQGPDIAAGLLLARHARPSASGAIHVTVSLWQSESDASCDANGRAALSIVRVLSSVPPAYFKHFVACTYNHASSGCPRSYTTDSPSCSWIHEKLAISEKHAAHFGLQATLRPASREGLVIQSFGSLLGRNPVPIASWATSGRQPAADLRLLLGNSQSPPVACE